MKEINKFLIYLAGVVLLLLYKGFVFKLLWEWFVSGTFGFQTLSLVQAMGLGLLLSLSTRSLPTRDTDGEEEEDTLINSVVIIVRSVIVWTLTLLIGFVISLFM